MKADGFLRATLENISRGMYDDFVESSCRSMRKTGAKAVIVRKEIGSCCDWCRSLAGTYDYSAGQYPDDIFRRHQNCRCIVTVSNEKGHYTDVWSKREYDSERELIRGRIEDIQHEEARTAVMERKARKRAKAVSEGKQFFDSTDFWKDADRRAGEDFYTGVKDPGKVFYKDGQRYEIDNHHVKFEPSQHEREIAKVLAEQLHEEVILQPVIKGQRSQATNFVFDITKCPLPRDVIERKLEAVLTNKKRDWIEKLILIDNGEIVKILERT